MDKWERRIISLLFLLTFILHLIHSFEILQLKKDMNPTDETEIVNPPPEKPKKGNINVTFKLG